MRILILDDDARVADLLADSVRFEGYDAVVATTPQSGLELLERDPPDAVFLDILMPRLNGLEVLRRIRQRSPGLPVIVITGFATDSQVAEARRLGALDVIEKPALLKYLGLALQSLHTRCRRPGDHPG